MKLSDAIAELLSLRDVLSPEKESPETALDMNLDSGSPPGMTNFGPWRAVRCVLA